MLSMYLDKNTIEAGIDEAGRGCLAGRVYAAAVIWPKEIPERVDLSIIKDSKKLSHKKRMLALDIIDTYAIDYAVGFVDEKTIDEINILQASYMAMHKALDNLTIVPENILVDGSYFRPYMTKDSGEFVPHVCFTKGDNKYMSIAAASIVAKEFRDRYITQLAESDETILHYGWKNNKSYGTKQHIEAIKKYGLTKYHRKSFSICKDYVHI